MKQHILVTGFKPFAGRAINGASTITHALQSQSLAGHTVNTVLLKVSWNSVEAFARQSLPHTTAACIIALGEADRPHISIETRATTVCEGEDVDGTEPTSRSLTPARALDDNAHTHELTLESAGIDTERVRALQALCQPGRSLELPEVSLSESPATTADSMNVQIKSSDDAGQYLCNRLLYLGLTYSPVPFVFIHLPIQGATATSDYLQRHLPAVQQIITQFAAPSL